MFPGSKVKSPAQDAQSGPSPSQMAGMGGSGEPDGDEQNPSTPAPADGNPASSVQPNPEDQLRVIIDQSRAMEEMLKNWAMNFPAAGKPVQDAVLAIRKALQQVVATGTPGQEPPAPSMMG